MANPDEYPAPWTPPVVEPLGPDFPHSHPDPYNLDPYYPDPYAML